MATLITVEEFAKWNTNTYLSMEVFYKDKSVTLDGKAVSGRHTEELLDLKNWTNLIRFHFVSSKGTQSNEVIAVTLLVIYLFIVAHLCFIS